MQEKINKIINDINHVVIKNNDVLIAFQKTYLSKRGIINDVISKFREAFEINVKEVGAGEENISFKLPRGI